MVVGKDKTRRLITFPKSLLEWVDEQVKSIHVERNKWIIDLIEEAQEGKSKLGYIIVFVNRGDIHTVTVLNYSISQEDAITKAKNIAAENCATALEDCLCVYAPVKNSSSKMEKVWELTEGVMYCPKCLSEINVLDNFQETLRIKNHRACSKCRAITTAYP